MERARNRIQRRIILFRDNPAFATTNYRSITNFWIGCSSVLLLLGVGLMLFSPLFGLGLVGLVLVSCAFIIWLMLWRYTGQQRELDQASAVDQTQSFRSEIGELKIELVHLTNRLDEAEQQEINYSRILGIAESLTEMSDVQSTLSKIVKLTISSTKADTGSLILLNGSSQVTDAIFPNRHLRPDEVQKLANQVIQNGIAGWVIRNKQPAIVFDAAQDKRWISLPDAPYKDRSAVSVPINQHNTIVGILTLIHHQPNHFDNRDLTMLLHVSRQIGVALSNAKIFEEQRALIERQTALHEVLKGISRQGDPKQTAQSTAETVVALTGVDVCAILVPNVDQKRLNPLAASPANAGRINYLSIDRSNAAGLAMLDQSVQLQNDVDTGESAVFEQCPIKSELFIPMVQADQVLGVLYLADREPFHFYQEDVILARAIAEATTMTIANANLVHALSDQTGRLNALIEANRDGLILVGPDHQILVVNQMALQLLDLETDPADWLHKQIEALCDYLKPEAEDLVASIEMELNHLTTYTHRTPKTEFPVGRHILQVSFLPILAQNLHVGRVIVLHDITERRLTEQMRNEITHTMVHDLRNPLHIISSGMSVLRSMLEPDLLDDPEQKQLVHIIETNSEKMLRLVNGILDISRLESQRLPINMEPFNLETQIEEARMAIEPLAKEKRVRIEIDIAPGTALIEADQELVSRVLQNLLDNGLKFTKENSKLVVSTAWSRDRSKVELSVSDQGPGIPEYLKNSLFEKFQTGQHAKSGSGLGLAFCRMALKAQNEKIWISSS